MPEYEVTFGAKLRITMIADNAAHAAKVVTDYFGDLVREENTSADSNSMDDPRFLHIDDIYEVQARRTMVEKRD